MVSIILPTYNRASTIRRAIDSVLKQSYAEYELIVIDDGSTDNTKQIIDSYTDERIIYIRLCKNSGVAHARNEGIKVARGKYIAFIDSDNTWDECHLESKLELVAGDHEKVFVFGNMHVFVQDEMKLIFPNLREECVKDRGQLLQLMLTSNRIDTNTVLLGSSCLGGKNMFDESMSALEDWDLFFRIIRQEDISLFFDEKATVKHYDTADSLSRKKNIFLTNRLKIYEKNRDIIRTDSRQSWEIDADISTFGQLSETEWNEMFRLLEIDQKDDCISFLSEMNRKQYCVYNNLLIDYRMQRNILEIDRIIVDRKLSSVALYGYGYYGKKLYKQLKNVGIKVPFVIDKNNGIYVDDETSFINYIPSEINADMLIVSVKSNALMIVEEIKNRLSINTQILYEL